MKEEATVGEVRGKDFGCRRQLGDPDERHITLKTKKKSRRGGSSDRIKTERNPESCPVLLPTNEQWRVPESTSVLTGSYPTRRGGCGRRETDGLRV